MEVFRIILMVIDILICLGVIAAVLMQSSRSAGISGTIGGASEQIFGKKKGLDDFLAKNLRDSYRSFFVITLILTLIFSNLIFFIIIFRRF